MSRPLVLLTNPIDPAGIEILETVAEVRVASDTSAETLRREARDALAIVVRAWLPDDLFEHTPLMRGAVRHGTGVDMIPIRGATEHGVAVANVPGANAVTVAEIAVGQFVALARQLHRMAADLREGGWYAARKHADAGIELAGKTVGILGVGAIGREIARICHHGFRMRVLGHQRRLDRLPSEVEGVTLDALFAASDFVAICCPLDDSTRGLVGERQLARMKPGAFIVNVSRGPVVDERALVAALSSGSIGGAALDVFDTHHLPHDHPLMKLPNVIVTPHVAGLTVESMRRMSTVVAEDVVRMLRGDLPKNLVNPEVATLARSRWASAAGSLA